MFRLCLGNRWIGLVVLGAVVGLSASMGCGGAKKATVKGTVTYKGEKLGNGNVVFLGADNKGASSPIDANGSYHLSNVPLGPVKITVETIAPIAATAPAMPGMEMPKIEGGPAAGKYVRIPDQYKDATRSGLTYEVKSGNHEHNINLE